MPKTSKKGGKTKSDKMPEMELTEELQSEFYMRFARGSTEKMAYEICGVPGETFYKWWRKGDPSNSDAHEPYLAWRKRCVQLLAEKKLDALEKVLNAGRRDGVGKNWPAYMTYLERVEPDDFGKKPVAEPTERPIAIQIVLGTNQRNQPTIKQPETVTLELPAHAGSISDKG